MYSVLFCFILFQFVPFHAVRFSYLFCSVIFNLILFYLILRGAFFCCITFGDLHHFWGFASLWGICIIFVGICITFGDCVTFGDLHHFWGICIALGDLHCLGGFASPLRIISIEKESSFQLSNELFDSSSSQTHSRHGLSGVLLSAAHCYCHCQCVITNNELNH